MTLKYQESWPSRSLDVIRICDYKLGYIDKGSGGQQDVTFFNPVIPSGYAMIGAYAQGNYHQANNCILAVKPSNKASLALVTVPKDWQLTWTDKNSGAMMDGSIWTPVSPDVEYICLGSVARQGYRKPGFENYVCLHQCLVENVPATNYIWSDKGTGASQKVSIYKLHNSNSFYAFPNHIKPDNLKDIKTDTTCKF